MMINDIKKNELNEQEIENVAGGNPFPNEALTTDEMKVQRELNNLTPLEQLEVLQQPDAASQKEKIIEILARRDVKVHGGGVSGSW